MKIRVARTAWRALRCDISTRKAMRSARYHVIISFSRCATDRKLSIARILYSGGLAAMVRCTCWDSLLLEDISE